jgi:hypothetical protein
VLTLQNSTKITIAVLSMLLPLLLLLDDTIDLVVAAAVAVG